MGAKWASKVVAATAKGAQSGLHTELSMVVAVGRRRRCPFQRYSECPARSMYAAAAWFGERESIPPSVSTPIYKGAEAGVAEIQRPGRDHFIKRVTNLVVEVSLAKPLPTRSSPLHPVLSFEPEWPRRTSALGRALAPLRMRKGRRLRHSSSSGKIAGRSASRPRRSGRRPELRRIEGPESGPPRAAGGRATEAGGSGRAYQQPKPAAFEGVRSTGPGVRQLLVRPCAHPFSPTQAASREAATECGHEQARRGMDAASQGGSG
jgi:hypothetical protein